MTWFSRDAAFTTPGYTEGEPMDELRDLVRLGACGIVLLDHQYEETASTHADTTTNTYACKIGGTAFEIEVAWSTNAYRMGQPVRPVELSRKPLSEAKYAALTAGKPLVDNPEALKKMKAHDAWTDNIRALTPVCPKCGARMQPKSGQHGQFWGCPRFPKCKGTKNMTPEYVALLHQQP
jgi:hypothetical protein